MLHKLLYVFTKEYRKEVKFYEFMRGMRNRIRLNTDSERIDDKVARLKQAGFQSNCHIKVDNF